MKSSAFLVIALTLASLNSGCSTAGRKFNADNVQQIEEGVTTKAEVVKLLGEPYTTHNNGGRTSFNYMCLETKLNPLSVVPIIGLFFISSEHHHQASQHVMVRFDQRDIVERVDASSSGDAANIKVNAASRSRQTPPSAAFAAAPVQTRTIPEFTKGKTTRDEIVAALGVPQDIKLDAGKQILTYKFPGDNPFDPNSGKNAIFILNDKAVLEDMIK